VSGVLEETLKLLKATTPTTITIKTTIENDSGILGDPTQIEQIIMNLCTNAVHAMKERGGVLDIRLSRVTISPPEAKLHGLEPGPYARLIVRDTGIGIPPHLVDKVFDPFFTTKDPGEGTGVSFR